MVERSDRMWSTGERNGKPLQYSCLENPMNSMKRPFRYDLNQIPYDCTVEVRNRFKGLDLIYIVPDEQWMEVHDIVQETGIKIIPMEKKL